ncbi:MAG: hypothetical protein DBP02_15095 [gamma proteobacterium symbiont of Ctena orbiculata]|nr:MAG: hypothetical protein DBP02_15095 [gamma proteobacterium symbiont of Ctena orbiculata]
MNVQPYVDLLTANAPTLQQAVVAPPGVQSLGVVSTDEILTVFSGVLGDRVYQMSLPQYPTYPNLVYQLVSSDPQVVDGYHVTHTDTLHLYVRDTTIDGLDTAVATVQAAIEASAWSIEVQDMMYDFDDEQNVYVAVIEITFVVSALPSQSLPAAIVYPVGTNADPSPFGNLVRQLERQSFAVVIISNSASIESLRREIQGALLGKQVHETQIQYQQGIPLDGGGGLMLWQEVYSDSLYIEQI